MANVLKMAKKVAAISCLCEGASIRATSRLTGVHRDTIGRLALSVGEGCARLHDALMRDLHCPLIEADEAWSFIHKKQKRVKHDDPWEFGDIYSFICFDPISKAIISYHTDKRDDMTTRQVIEDLRQRVLGRIQISTDGWKPYVNAIEDSFGSDADYAMIIKEYGSSEVERSASRRYSPGAVQAVEVIKIMGRPDEDKICTSLVERQNLTLRMHTRRFTRLTNGFSKQLRNHRAAFDLYVAYYNFVRVHQTTRVTPAMQLGVTDHVWSVQELIEAALATDDGAPPPRPTKVAPRLNKVSDLPGDQEPQGDPRAPVGADRPGRERPVDVEVARPTKAPFLRLIDGGREDDV
jgi:IS1 family transposase